ncbi:MAG: 30S ribosomal protein S4 [Kiritimatiellae bacterium]|nr:30S ribosomal protein S4 [Kiritimatiellia bacterium]
MGRYTGPACRLCRREQMKLFLKGARCTMAKCPIDTERPVPGMHGQRRGRKMSDYGTQLREKQRLRRQYGLREKQFRLFFERAERKRGVTGEELLQMLETRLDNIVFRLGFAPSRRAARQLVTHNHVQVNDKKADVSSMILSVGSVVKIKDREKSKGVVQKALEMTEGRDVPSWLLLDAKNCSGEVVRIPTREEIAPIVNEQLIVELYSK